MRVRGLIEWAVLHFKASMIVICGLSGLCLIAAAIIFGLSNSSPRATILDINIAPSIATITIDGAESRNGSYVVEPGVHHVEASAEGFKSKSFDIDVKRDETNSLSSYLVNKDEGMKYYERSKTNIDILRSVAKNDDEIKAFVDSYDKKNKIYLNMPIKDSYHTTQGFVTMTIKDARSDKRCRTTLCIQISGYKVNDTVFNNHAAKLLNDYGYDIKDYEVFYVYK